MESWNGVPEDWGKGHYRDVPVCKWVKLSRERQINDLRRAAAGDPEFPYYFDNAAADRAVGFMRLLRLFDGEWAGQPFTLSDWQEWDIVRPLFGWKKRGSNLRRFRRADVIIPKKNGKTPLAAAIGSYMLLADREPGARVMCAATKEGQAREVWDAARKMLQNSPELRAEVKVFKSSLFNEVLGSSFVPIGRDSESSDGPSVHCGIVDEEHAHKNRDIIDILDNALGARRQPLVLKISTLGIVSTSPIWATLEFGKKLLEKVLSNEEQLFYFTTVDDPEKWDDPIEYQKANPNFGISIYQDGFESDLKAAKESPEKQIKFKCKRLNMRVDQDARWIPLAKWNLCGGIIPLETLRGKPCFAGLDLGITQDISSLVLAFERGVVEIEGQLLPLIWLVTRHWIPEVGMLDRWRNDRVDYPLWKEQGWISSTPGDTTRYDIIRRDINDLAELYDIKEIAIDRAHAHQLMVDLADDGFNIVKHAQTMLAMNFPCRAFEELMLQQRLRHGDDPVLRWMASNAVIVIDGNENMKIVKDRSIDRVDGMVAAVMAVGRLLIAPKEPEFIYNSRGMAIV